MTRTAELLLIVWAAAAVAHTSITNPLQDHEQPPSNARALGRG